MEVNAKSESGKSLVTLCSIKRKALTIETGSSKRARVEQNTAEADYDTSDSDDLAASTNADSISQVTSSIATPLTPVSPVTLPRHPSDLYKSHHCPYANCDKSFNRPAKLAQHVRSHTNTRPFVCPHAPCTKDFLRDSHLKHHIKSAHSDVRDFVCEWEGCGKNFITSTRLRRHHVVHEGKEKFKCTVAGCGQTFRKHGTLQKHTTTIHEGRDPFVCEELDHDERPCGAGFDTVGKLRSHMGRVHGMKKFMCTICPTEHQSNGQDALQQERVSSFPTHAALQAHFASDHPPTCTVCGLKCTSQSALKNHIEVIHGGLDIDERRTHICPEPTCGRGFTKKGNLNAHIQISHAGKRFVCGVVDPKTLNNVGDWDGSDACGEASTTKANLERHIRGMHMGLESSSKAEKKGKFGAATASAKKIQESTLTRLTGAGYESESGRDILCLVQRCNYRFMRDYDLEIHLQSRHGLADLEIQDMLMDKEFYDQPASHRLLIAATEQGFGPPSGLNMHYSNEVNMDNLEESLGTTALGGGEFWPGGQQHQVGIGGGCRMESNEGGDHGQDVDMIDPSLR